MMNIVTHLLALMFTLVQVDDEYSYSLACANAIISNNVFVKRMHRLGSHVMLLQIART